MIRWHSRTRWVRFESLRLPGDWKARLERAHLADRVASIREVGVINLPVVAWELDGEKRRELVAGCDRVAALVVNGLKPTDSIEVRCFDADSAEDVRRVRIHENLHRRHDDRDALLRELVAMSGGGANDRPQQPDEADEKSDAWTDDLLDLPSGPVLVEAAPVPENPLADFADAWVEPEPAPAITAQPVRKKAGRPKTEKGAARERAAAVAGTTPEAVRAAEYRDRKKRGEVEPKQASSDGLSPDAERVCDGLDDVAHALTQAQRRLTVLLTDFPGLAERFNIGGARSLLSEAATFIRGIRPAGPCCYCSGDGECQACRKSRWLTADQLDNAPAELRGAP